MLGAGPAGPLLFDRFGTARRRLDHAGRELVALEIALAGIHRPFEEPVPDDPQPGGPHRSGLVGDRTAARDQLAEQRNSTL